MTSRERFERWVLSHGDGCDIERIEPGEYRSAPTECAWTAWQASEAATARRIAELEEQLRLANLDAAIANVEESDEVKAIMRKWAIESDESLTECVERNIDGWKQRCLRAEAERDALRALVKEAAEWVEYSHAEASIGNRCCCGAPSYADHEKTCKFAAALAAKGEK